MKDYRGQVYIGTEGYGAGGYIGINYDNYETLYNQGCSIILNADSVLTNPLGGASRITSQAARNQLLGTVGTEIYAGYAGIDPAYTYFAGIEQYFVNSYAQRQKSKRLIRNNWHMATITESWEIAVVLPLL